MDRKKKEGEIKKEISYKEVIPHYINKNCEIIVKNPMASIDVLFSAKDTLIDADEEWIMLVNQEKTKKSVKVFQIENISGIKEIISD